jgi:hypothetical protein
MIENAQVVENPIDHLITKISVIVFPEKKNQCQHPQRMMNISNHSLIPQLHALVRVVDLLQEQHDVQSVVL